MGIEMEEHGGQEWQLFLMLGGGGTVRSHVGGVIVSRSEHDRQQCAPLGNDDQKRLPYQLHFPMAVGAGSGSDAFDGYPRGRDGDRYLPPGRKLWITNRRGGLSPVRQCQSPPAIAALLHL